MKKLIRFLLVLAAPILVSASGFAQSFEGIIVNRITSPMMGDPMDMTINVKGNKIMMEMDGGAMGGMKIYLDKTDNKQYIVMSAMKMGYEVASSVADKAEKGALTAPALKPTGKAEKINGHQAEEFTAELEDATMDLWLAKDFPKEMIDAMASSMRSNSSQSEGQLQLMKLISEKGYAPVRFSVKNGDETLATIDFIKFEKKSLSDDLFILPTDIKFTKLDPSQMGQ